MKRINKLLVVLLLPLALIACEQKPLEPVSADKTIMRDGMRSYRDTDKPVTGIVRNYYANGQLLIETSYVDGEKDGSSKIFHENGQVRVNVNYKEGSLGDIVEFFHENGQLTFRILTTHNDEGDHGLQERFDENGKLQGRKLLTSEELKGLTSRLDAEEGRLLESDAMSPQLEMEPSQLQ